jgi:hypothetical protein
MAWARGAESKSTSAAAIEGVRVMSYKAFQYVASRNEWTDENGKCKELLLRQSSANPERLQKILSTQFAKMK